MPPKPASEDPQLGPLTDDLLTPEVRVYQRRAGHRFSSDDVATAYVAHGAAPHAPSVLDLGTGLGSVLLLLAWRMPRASLVGVEAQDGSFELLRRNVERNRHVASLGERVTIHHGDLRDEALLSGVGGPFSLVTGTPPYFPEGTAVDARDSQRAHARLEHRGGVEVYLDAAARLVAETGSVVLCGDARAEERASEHAASLALDLVARTVVIPRAGRAPLFSVWTFRRGAGATAVESRSMTLRDWDGQPTSDADALRIFSGFPPR